ncbi:MAG TPA: ABC transporter permease [Polyangia bacterium]|nr:ABC transporter permease [Polyangia bacterium]
MSGRALVIAWKELIQLRRDRLTLAMVAALPVMQLLLFGYAINTDVRHIPLVVFDQDRSADSRDLARSLVATGFYDLAGAVTDYAEIEHALRSSRARAALVIPSRYASDLRLGRPTKVQLIVDGSDPQTVASATDAASGLVAARDAELTVARLRGAARGPAGGRPLLSLEPETWYNPELRTAVFVVPGLVGVILTMTMIMFTAMAIARERERGTLEQLIVSPIGRVELMVGKILPYVAIGYLQMTIVLLIGATVFRTPVAGSAALLYVLALLFIAANLALGLVFSTVARTQQQAMQMSFFFLLPNILLSGFMFPYDAMPRAAQVLAQALPLTHFLRIVRGIALRGAGFGDLGGELLWLGGILVALVAIAALRFQKKVA